MRAVRLTPFALLLVASLAACGGEETTPEPDPALDRQLIEVARAGDLDAVRSLLERGAGVDARDETGATALVAAAYGNHVEVARALIEAGADVDVEDDTVQSAYLIATSEVGDDPTLLELTLDAGADVNAKDSYDGTGLIRAADRGLRGGRPAPARDRPRRRPRQPARLDGAARGGHPRTAARGTPRVVRLLAEGGVDVNIADQDGVTPLAHARRAATTRSRRSFAAPARE